MIWLMIMLAGACPFWLFKGTQSYRKLKFISRVFLCLCILSPRCCSHHICLYLKTPIKLFPHTVCKPTPHYTCCIVPPLSIEQTSDFVCSNTKKIDQSDCELTASCDIPSFILTLVLSFPCLVWIDEHKQKAGSVKKHHMNSLSSMCSVLCGW